MLSAPSAWQVWGDGGGSPAPSLAVAVLERESTEHRRGRYLETFVGAYPFDAPGGGVCVLWVGLRANSPHFPDPPTHANGRISGPWSGVMLSAYGA